MTQKNYGLNWNLELEQQTEKDWIFGATSPVCIAEGIPFLEREKYLPKGEVQQGAEDMADCATRGPINILEIKLNWLVKNKKLSDNTIKFLNNNRYLNIKGEVELSDAWIAIKSKTTPQGNSMKAPCEAIRVWGILPKKLLPLEKWMTWADYHNPKRITKEMEDLAKKSLEYLGFNYERVYNTKFDELLNRDLLDLCGFAWPEPINGEYPRTDNYYNHVFVGIRMPRTFIFDNYIDSVDGDFVKKLASNYDFGETSYRLIISEKKTPEEIEELKKTLYQKIIDTMYQICLLIQKEISNLKGRIRNYLGNIFK